MKANIRDISQQHEGGNGSQLNGGPAPRYEKVARRFNSTSSVYAVLRAEGGLSVEREENADMDQEDDYINIH